MNRKEAAEKLMRFVIEKEFNKKDKPYDLLVKDGFAGERPIAPWHSSRFEYFATAATPLALLTPTQLDCAGWLVDERQVAFRVAEPLQRRQVAAMAKEGLVNEGMWSWKPTPKLIEAVKCWREAKESRS